MSEITTLEPLTSRRVRKLFLGPIVFLVLLGGITIASLTPLSYGVFFAAAVSLIVSLFPERVRDLVLGAEQPSLSLESLQILRFGPGAKLERSQWVNMSCVTLGHEQNSLTALFGILRVSARGSDAIDCRAAVRTRVQGVWLDRGYLNWFSQTRINNLMMIPSLQLASLNVHLTNTVEHIPRDESKDLLVFYMVQNSPSVLICSDMAMTYAGSIQNEQPAKFQFEVSLTAQHQRRIVRLFDVEASWGRILIANAAEISAAQA